MTDEHGFVMADAVIALLVIAVSMTALLNLTFSSNRASETADKRLTATLIARAIAEDETVTEDTGHVSVNGQSYDWRLMRLRERVTGGAVLQLERISVEVSEEGWNPDRKVIYRTARWSAPNAR